MDGIFYGNTLVLTEYSFSVALSEVFFCCPPSLWLISSLDKQELVTHLLSGEEFKKKKKKVILRQTDVHLLLLPLSAISYAINDFINSYQ